MKPIDFRNETFEAIKDRLTSLRRTVWEAWLTHGPGTTKEIAQRSGIDLLTFRPRTTELCDAGLVYLVDGPSGRAQGRGHEGVYKARRFSEWQQWFEENRRRAVNPQMTLI